MSKEFDEALNLVLKLRNERKKCYGDGWLEDPIQYDIWMMHGKVKRLLYMLEKGENKYEKMLDSAIDLCNYSLFLIYKLTKKEK